MENLTKHIPVLLQETITNLNIMPEGCFIDVTLGGGGHFFELLKKLENKGCAIGMDTDELALKRTEDKLENLNFKLIEQKSSNYKVYQRKELKVILINDNFINLKEYKEKFSEFDVKAVFADLGLSADQLEDQKLGLSFQKDTEKLDMRLDKNLKVTASDLLNGLYKNELEKMFFEFGDVAFTKNLVREIVKTRTLKPIKTVGELKQIIQRIVPFYLRRGTNKHPEAKVFQALRIAVNQELLNLQSFLPQAFETLASGGRLGVITFHSGEDRIVKDYFRDLVDTKKGEYISKVGSGDNNTDFTTKYFTASIEELNFNKKSHSAKLRIVSKN